MQGLAALTPEVFLVLTSGLRLLTFVHLGGPRVPSLTTIPLCCTIRSIFAPCRWAISGIYGVVQPTLNGSEELKHKDVKLTLPRYEIDRGYYKRLIKRLFPWIEGVTVDGCSCKLG